MTKQMIRETKPSINVNEVMEVVRTLPIKERQQVRALLESLAEPELPMAEDEFERELIAEGILIDRNDFRFPSLTADRQGFKPVPITGKPVSEIIVVEERR